MHKSATLIHNLLISRKLFENCFSGVGISDLSDHFPCLVTLCDILPRKRSEIYIENRDLSNEYFKKVANDLNQDWSAFFMNMKDVNKLFDEFYKQLMNSIEKRCELKKVKLTSKHVIKEPKLTKGIIQSSRKQLWLYKIYLHNKSIVDYERYKQYWDCLKKIKCTCKCLYFSQHCERYKHNTKKLWATINKMTGQLNNKSSVIDYITVDGVKKFSLSEISNEFAKFYANIDSSLADKTPPSKNSIEFYLEKSKRSNLSIFLQPCTRNEISKIIQNLKNKSSSGYDGISNIIIKEIESVLLTHLEYIINMSLSTGTFPTSMKQADVIPLFKSGDEHIVGNYRPISLLLTL